MVRVRHGALALGIALAVTGCGKKKIEELPAPSQAPVTQNEPPSSQPAPGSQADFLARMAGQDVIFFGTDRYDIDAVDAAALQTQAAWLQRYPGKMARIEGHADERGTREYNLALGERRAHAARNYLIGIGIAANRLTVVSFGKERPEALGSDEASWQRNRRAVTVTID